MRVLLAGAGGAVGQQLIPMLAREGHNIGALTRSQSKRDALASVGGVTPFIADALDPAAVENVVATFRPDAIIHQLTAIPQVLDMAHFDRAFALTNRLRTEGTDNLIAAAKKWGVERFVAQGFAGWPYARTGGAIKTEDDPFDPDPPPQFRSTLQALQYLEQAVLRSFPERGTVLRYGWFYGPQTSLSRNGPMAEAVVKRKLPIVGGGEGVWSFLHIEDAASAAVAALHCNGGIYNIADDRPALVRDWVSMLAQLLGARQPLHVPAWIARFAIGRHGVLIMTENRGISNQKAKRELAWTPRYPDWRAGFKSEFAADAL